MADDLVKRLREVKDWWREPGRTAEQAADRIEALEEVLIGIACNCNGDYGDCYYNHVIAHCPHKQARAALEGKDD